MTETVKPSIIVLDDDPDMADLVSFTAQSMGFDVRIAANAVEFMMHYNENEPSAIVMDIVMPDMDGLELLTWLANQNCTSRIALMSGYDGKYIGFAKNIALAKGVTIDKTLTKPFKLEELGAFLQQILDAKEG